MLLIEVPPPGSSGRVDKHENEGGPLCSAWIAQILSQQLKVTEVAENSLQLSD